MLKLKTFRKANKLTGKKMAKELDCSPSYYYKIERGERTPSYAFLKKFSKVFPDVSIDDIFFRR